LVSTGVASTGIASVASTGIASVASTSVASTSVANANVGDTTVLRGGGSPVAGAPGTAAAAGPDGVVSPVTEPRAYGTAWAALPCSASLTVVSGVSYYQCGSTWFTRSYVDGNIAYVVTNPPG
jgi:hypothetical protein